VVTHACRDPDPRVPHASICFRCRCNQIASRRLTDDDDDLRDDDAASFRVPEGEQTVGGRTPPRHRQFGVVTRIMCSTFAHSGLADPGLPTVGVDDVHVYRA
jgi:hypothetical protein